MLSRVPVLSCLRRNDIATHAVQHERVRNSGRTRDAKVTVDSGSDQLVGGGGMIVLELSELTFCESIGLAGLLRSRAGLVSGPLVQCLRGAGAQRAESHVSVPVVRRRIVSRR
jgi:hypothetical protein